MKTKINTLIFAGSLFLCAALLAGCSKNAHNGGEENEEVNPKAIRLSAGVMTKAPVNTGDAFTAAVAGWESQTEGNYGVKRTWLTTSNIMAAEAAGSITLADEQHYSQNSAMKTFMRAWSPAGTLADNGTVTFEAADGETDVMLASKVSGSFLDAEIKNITFDHVLTQIKFAVKGDADFETVTLTSISIKDAQLPASIDLTTDAVGYSAAATLAVPGITDTQAITTEAVAAGRAIMMKPLATTTFKIDVVTSTAIYTDVVVTINDTAVNAGKAYTVTLTFDSEHIKVGAMVTPWIEGTGEGAIK